MKLIKPLVLAASMATVLATNAVIAQEEGLVSDGDALEKAFPELNEPAATRSATSMRCFVDTPALDPWQSPFCFSIGTAFTTSAVFNITNPPSNFTILWSDSRCSSSSTSCVLPIRQYQQFTLSATILNNSNNTFVQRSATARYEGFF